MKARVALGGGGRRPAKAILSGSRNTTSMSIQRGRNPDRSGRKGGQRRPATPFAEVAKTGAHDPEMCVGQCSSGREARNAGGLLDRGDGGNPALRGSDTKVKQVRIGRAACCAFIASTEVGVAGAAIAAHLAPGRPPAAILRNEPAQLSGDARGALRSRPALRRHLSIGMGLAAGSVDRRQARTRCSAKAMGKALISAQSRRARREARRHRAPPRHSHNPTDARPSRQARSRSPCRPISSFAIARRWTSSGPSAIRRARTPA